MYVSELWFSSMTLGKVFIQSISDSDILPLDNVQLILCLTYKLCREIWLSEQECFILKRLVERDICILPIVYKFILINMISFVKEIEEYKGHLLLIELSCKLLRFGESQGVLGCLG